MIQFDKNASFIDVREPSEFRQEHIPNAINIPLDQVPSRVEEIDAMQRPIVVYCRSGKRSEMAFIILAQKGVQNIFNGGGIEDVKHSLR